MDTNQWLTLGIYTSSAVFTAVGFFIVREIRRNDRELQEIRSWLKSLDHRASRHSTAVKIMQMALEQKGILPSTIKFPSPSGREESA